MFSALKIPNYRLWTAGALVSNIGTWMQRVAQDWLVLTILTNHDGTATGITTGLQFLPILFLGPFAGVLADRMNKRKLLLITQSSMGVFATILGVLVATGTAELWHVYLLAFGLGVASAFDAPARQAFVSELVPARELPNAVALNSASFNLARLAGPGVAGLLIAAFGTGPAFLINAASFGAVIFSLAKMRSEQFQPTMLVARQKGQIRDGLAYVRKRPDLLLIFALAFVVATFGLNFQLTNAMMATDIFHVGAGAFGLLGTIMAVGTLAGALLAARRGKPRMRYLLGGAVGFGAMALIASFMPTFFWYAVMMVPVGLASLTFLNSANTMIQLSVDPAYRGRVLGLYIMVVQGGTPLGAPLVGWLGTEFGARWSVGSGAVLSLAAGLIAVVVVLRRARRTPKPGTGTPARHKAATRSRSKVRALVPLLGR
ncbi:MFS transporter [Arthrobacter sp. AQ5-05]|uniref:MFS transporter n=1 Tax=Arthrobacter sp. AQ5-05 TaxID=2184581 RepID=UPI000DCCB073|nr:MFS transporter [Arthrobacter sp. AQ5-05]RAX50452.1 MFS transporter [Arthrobacter sp. AQ5-05]